MDIFARSAIDDFITDDVLLFKSPRNGFSCAAPTIPTCAAPTLPTMTGPAIDDYITDDVLLLQSRNGFSCAGPTLPACAAPTVPTMTAPTWNTAQPVQTETAATTRGFSSSVSDLSDLSLADLTPSVPSCAAWTGPTWTAPTWTAPTWKWTGAQDKAAPKKARRRRPRKNPEWIETYRNGTGCRVHVFADNVEVSQAKPWKQQSPVTTRRWFGPRRFVA